MLSDSRPYLIKCSIDNLSLYNVPHVVIFVGLSSLMYQATEGPNAVATVCATIEAAVRPVQRDTSILIVTPVTGGTITGIVSHYFDKHQELLR